MASDIPADARLIGTRGPLTGREILLNESANVIVIGRGTGADVTVADASVSRRHCEIRRDGDRHRLTDLKSTHGTLVNEQVVTNHTLEHGDRLLIGESELLYLIGDGSVGRIAVDLGEADVTISATAELPIADAHFLHPEKMLGDASTLPLGAMVDVSEAIRSLRDPTKLAERLLQSILATAPADRAAVLRVDADVASGKLTIRDVIAIGGGGPDQPVRVSRTIVSQVAMTTTAIISNNVGDELLWAGAASVRAARVVGVLCVPIVLNERAIGVIYLDTSRSAARFGDNHLQFVAAVAGLAALPFAHAWRHGGELLEAIEAIEAIDTAGPAGVDSLGSEAHGDAATVDGRAAILLRPTQQLHIGNALLLRSPLARLSEERFPRLVLVFDYAIPGEPEGSSGLCGAVLDRLALFHHSGVRRVALASRVPSIARLAAMVASLVRPGKDMAHDYLLWFREILLAAGLVASRATHAVVEPDSLAGATVDPTSATPLIDPAMADLLVTRRLVTQLNQLSPGICPFPVPLLSGFRPFLSLDGRGLMGATDKGAIYVTDSADAIVKKIRTARTDLKPSFEPDEQVSPEVRNLLLLMFALTGESTSAMIDRYAGRGYSAIKTDLVDAVNAFLDPIRVRRAALANDPDLRESIARESARVEASGREIAELLGRGPFALT